MNQLGNLYVISEINKEYAENLIPKLKPVMTDENYLVWEVNQEADLYLCFINNQTYYLARFIKWLSP